MTRRVSTPSSRREHRCVAGEGVLVFCAQRNAKVVSIYSSGCDSQIFKTESDPFPVALTRKMPRKKIHLVPDFQRSGRANNSFAAPSRELAGLDLAGDCVGGAIAGPVDIALYTGVAACGCRAIWRECSR